MEEIIQIKCPFDGAVLSVKNQAGIESKNVTCPICKHKYPFTQFKRIIPAIYNDEEETDTAYPGSEERTKYAYGEDTTEATQTAKSLNLTIGKVYLTGTNVSFQLKPGRNIIGRRASKSEAEFQIDTGEKRSMSREHIVIEVKRIQSKGFVHYLSLYKEKVNNTYIGNQPLIYGDCIVLNHGDIIKLPDATLKFEIPDGEGTIY